MLRVGEKPNLSANADKKSPKMVRAKVEKSVEIALPKCRSPNLHTNFRKKKMKSK